MAYKYLGQGLSDRSDAARELYFQRRVFQKVSPPVVIRQNTALTRFGFVEYRRSSLATIGDRRDLGPRYRVADTEVASG